MLPQVTRYGYDLAGRLIADTATDGAVERRAFDRAGNVSQVVTRRGDALSMANDEVNRLRTRSMSGRLFPKEKVGLAAITANDTIANPRYPRKPNDPNGYRIAPETHSFEYNELGLITSARNSDAHVSHSR